MSTNDKCCTIVPYFRVYEGKMEEFKTVCEQTVANASKEPKCLYYGFSFNGDIAHCREGYADAEGALTHMNAPNPLIQHVGKLFEFTSLEIHGPAEELEKLYEPLADRPIKFFTLEYGFRR